MMIVKRIDVTPINEFSPETGGSGKVSFITDTGDMIFDCQVKPGRDAEKRNPMLAFISEAMRQVQRMPEYRISKSYVKFAPGVLPEGFAS
ncbi:hypothetical protein [Planktotalea arctica]|uniref:hypothetical protein n=1 Tax=Planktotalea arctica TaxID=1481893 RepID=UPI000A16ECB6|nr:hypothetical protein [Planktotalea arctica]